MSLQIKLQDTFRTLIETQKQFGENNIFISLCVSSLNGGESVVDNCAKIYLGVLKYYNVIVNQFKTIELFIKLEPKELKLSKYGFDQDRKQQVFVYDFKFHNEFVAYKYILPILNQSFNNRKVNESENQCSFGQKPSSSKNVGNAYTIEEFKNDVRYREVGNPKKMQHRHSWISSTYEEQKEEKFFTIKPSSTLALNEFKNYQETTENIDEILKLFPKFYHGEVCDDNNKDNIVVIENMLPAGFRSSNDAMFLDKDQILLTLKALGKFHASSYIAKHNSPREFKKAVSKLKATGWTLPEYWDIYPNFLDEHLLRGINFLKTDPHYKKYVYKFDSILKNPKDYFFRILNTDDNMAVICHGDFSKNNILYRYLLSSEEVSKKHFQTISGDNSPLNSTKYQEDVSVNRLNSKGIKIQEETNSSHNYRNSKEIQKELHPTLNTQEIMHIQTNETFLINNANKSNEDIEKNHLKRSKNNTEDIEILTSKLELFKREKINKEAVNKFHSNTIGDNRKSFLDQILETNSNEQPHTIKFENQGKENKFINQNENSITNDGTFTSETRDASTKMYSENFIDNTKMSNNIKNDNSVENKNETYKSLTPLMLRSSQFIRQQSSENLSNNSNIRKTLTDQENHILTDRLNYLEDKYKELERIYKVNQCVLEKRRVNMKIIEKLNEKKEILEEICKKIENINAKQEMEFKLQTSMTKLYQNVDDLDFKQRWKPLLGEVKTKPLAKNKNQMNDGAAEPQELQSQNKEKQSSTAGKTQNIANTTTILENRNRLENHGSRQTVHKSNCDVKSMKQTVNGFYDKRNNIEDEFNSLYEKSFSKDNLIEYEKIFSELTRKMEEDVQIHPDTISIEDSAISGKKLLKKKSVDNQKKLNTSHHQSNKALFQGIKTYKQQYNINIREDSKTISENYQTLTVKQRRDNLERSISLSNGSFRDNHKGMRKSNTDRNLLKINKPLISERNILIDDQIRNDSFDRDSLKEDLLRDPQSNSRARIFTTSSLDINVEEECEYDDVFENSKTINEAQKLKTKTHTQPPYENKDDLKRSKSFVEIGKNSSRPIPMKRTISLIENSIGSSSKTCTKQTKLIFEKYKPIYDGDEIEDGERIFEEANIALLGVHYIDNAEIQINQRRDHSQPETNQQNNIEDIDKRNLNRTMSQGENNTISDSHHGKGKIEVTEPVAVKKNISLLGVSDGDSKQSDKHVKSGPTAQSQSSHETYHPRSSSTFPRTSKGKNLDTIKKINKTVPLNSKPQNQSNISEIPGPKENFTLPRTSKGKLLDELKTAKGTSPLLFGKDTKDIVFFDLARMIYSSPVIDLSFFLFLNVSQKLRNECWDEFISIYYDSLFKSVPATVKVPSRTELLKEVKKKAMYGYFLCCFFLPWMMEEHPHKEAEDWVHHGGREGTEAIANILKFLIDRDYV